MKLKLRQVRLFFFILGFVILSAGAGYWFGIHQVKVRLSAIPKVQIERTLPADKVGLDFSLFWEVWDRLSASYLDKSALDQSKMVYGAISGMVSSLGDPYTVFLPPSANKQTKEDLNGAFDGIGIQLGYKNERLAVVAPLSGMPAEKVGIKAGDYILKIGDKDTANILLPEAVDIIRGPKGTSIKLTLQHQGEDKSYEVTVSRTTIVIPSVEVKFIDNVGQLKLSRFGDRTPEEWEKAVDQIVNKPGVKGVILDLRNNPGGYLSGAVYIGSEFINSGIVVQQEDASGNRETFSVNRKGRLTQIPLVVLVNQGSASASEIVAGALQERQTKIVGETTFGKGTIQEAQDLGGNSGSGEAGLHITTSRWLLPSGQSIDKKGIKPDIEVKDDPATEKDEQLEAALKLIK